MIKYQNILLENIYYSRNVLNLLLKNDNCKLILGWLLDMRLAGMC